MGKQILVFKGSPREKGNSSILADKAAEGAKNAGAQIKSYSLHRMDIRPCDGCDICHETQKCVCLVMTCSCSIPDCDKRMPS